MVPQEPEFHNNLGLVLAALDRPDDAIGAHRRALALAPGPRRRVEQPRARPAGRNHVDEAIDAFRRALALAPDFTQARWNLALALLAAGSDREAWPYYEARREVASFADLVPPPSAPRWDGSDPRGRTILLTPEQGLGDAIQFVRFVPLLAARGARVILQAARPLLPLFQDVAGVANVVAADDPRPANDAWLPLLSLPGALGLGADDIPAEVPYLAAAPHRSAEVQRAMGPRAGRELRAGLAWAGNPRNAIDRRRSVNLARLVPLLDLPGVRWFSLARGDGEDQLAACRRRRSSSVSTRATTSAAPRRCLKRWTCVVTVDTSIAHLAGALARPTFVMLPFAADWRWRTSAHGQPVVPDAAPVPAGGARGLGERRRGRRRRYRHAHAFALSQSANAAMGRGIVEDARGPVQRAGAIASRARRDRRRGGGRCRRSRPIACDQRRPAGQRQHRRALASRA